MFVCPVGHLTIFKSIYILAATGPAQVQVSAQDQVNGTYLQLVLQEITALTPTRWEGWLILEEGDQLVGYADRGDVRFWASGTLLPLP